MDLLALQNSPEEFRRALVIDTDLGPRPLGECLDPWQRADFEAMDAGWKRCIGQPVEGEFKLRAWLERGRGHSKSSDAMTMATWALFASRKQLSGVVCAVDRDQAALDRDHVARFVSLNPWLSRVIDVQQWRIVNKHTGSALDILSSDAPSSYGLLIDFAVCDEISIWPKRDLFDSILSAVAKKSTALLLCIGNAGFEDSWAWGLRESVRIDAAWHFSRLEGPVASWITAANLDEQRRLLPGLAFDRLWLNRWSAAGGDALTREVIDRAFSPLLRPHQVPEPGLTYVGGLDLGVSRDASAFCVLGVRRSHAGHGTIELARLQLWRPTPGSKVDLSAVEAAIAATHSIFDLKSCSFDPWNAAMLASRLQAGGLSVFQRQLGKLAQTSRVPMVEVPQTGANLQQQASVLVQLFNDGLVRLYEQPDLRRDLTKLRVEERTYGFRLVSPRDEHGHGDAASAFSLACVSASTMAAKRQYRAGPEPRVGTAFDAAVAEHEKEAERWRAAMESGKRTDPNDSPFLAWMKKVAPRRI